MAVYTYPYTPEGTALSGVPTEQYFTYGDSANPDRLTRFGTKAITYDALGRPSSYNGRSFNWNNGKLKTITKGSVKDWSLPYEAYTYTYNAKGQRTSKTYFYRPPDNLSLIGNYLRNTNISYTYDNSGRLIREKRTLTYSDFSTLAIEFIYLYDESGIIGVQFTYGDEAPQLFYYQHNLQGDVVAIYNTSGVLQASYSYNTWGDCTVANSTNARIANYNPIRYRGYYLDTETNWYFLNARYYSPEWRRFISPSNVSAFNPKSVNGLNLYVYAENDPIAILHSINSNGSSKFNNYSFITVLSIADTTSSLVGDFNKNYWNVHWKNTWVDTDWPGFLVLSKEGFEVVNWGLSIYKGSLFFDNNENHSTYISTGNIGIYAGVNYKEGIGIDAGASVLGIGYDGRIVDASIEGLTIGFTYMYKDGTFTFGAGYGWYGWSISIDFVELFKLLFGGA